MIIEKFEQASNGRFLVDIIQKANKLKDSGFDVVSLAIGEPYFTANQQIKNAGIDAIRHAKTRYTASTGLSELKNEIKAHLGLGPEISVVISSGAKPLIPAAIYSLSEPNDLIAVLGPAYPSFVESSLIMNRKVLQIDVFEKGKHKSVDVIFKEIDSAEEKVKVLIVNSPNNPSGKIYNEKELIKIVGESEKRGIAIISDETYDEFVYDDNFFVSLHDVAGMFARYVVIKSFSKSYGMTGWRVGYAFGTEEITRKMGDYLTACVGSAPTISQHSAVVALSSGNDDLQEAVKEFNLNRKELISWLQTKGIKVRIPDGGFYIFADFSSILNEGTDATILCHEILEKANVALAPGATYGQNYRNFIRFSFCVKKEILREAMQKIDQIL